MLLYKTLLLMTFGTTYVHNWPWIIRYWYMLQGLNKLNTLYIF